MFFLRDGVNDPLYLEDLFGNLARVLPVFNEEKIQEQMGGHVVSKCKEDKFEGDNVTNFGFVKEISDLWKRFWMSPGHEFIGKKARPSRYSVLELWISEA